ncbi:hypothetical protein JCM24511_08915 [Saitozyma sp. JCM 24511]|nr:hypothetical protein JCM24511_08915 [Saitozyma sp. JCM 24511]
MARSAASIAKSKALEIRVHPEGRHLVSGEKDEPFFWLADTAWELFHRLDESEAKLYLDKRAAQGFNVVFVVVFAEHGGCTLPSRAGHWPFLPLDPSSETYQPNVFKPNPAYFEFIDWVVDYAASVGIRIALQPVWGNYVAGVYHRIEHWFDDAEAAYSFGHFCANRYPFLPWLNGGDVVRHWFDDAAFNARVGLPVKAPHVVVKDYGPIFEAFADGITAGEAAYRGDGSMPFIAFHPAARWLPDTPKAISSHMFPDSKWLTIDGIQSGHAVRNTFVQPKDESYGRLNTFTAQNSVDVVREMYETSGKDGSLRPVIDLEPHYESTHYSFKPEEPFWKASNIRQGAWQSMFAGAAGLTYGVNSVWQMNNLASTSHPPINHHTASEFNWFDELDLPGAHMVSTVMTWFLSRPTFFSRSPDQSFILSDTFDRDTPEDDVEGKDAKLIAGMRCDQGKWLAVYSPGGAPFEVDLSVLRGEKATASWFNPRNGVTTPAQPVELGGTVSVIPPSTGSYEHDWVYYLETPSEHS